MFERQSSFLSVEPTAQHDSGETPLIPFLTLTLLLPIMIVTGDFVLGLLTPITASPDDEFILIDPVWRLVQGQYLGIDFHDPMGFGLFQMAALLWRLVGPHHYVLRASADLFALVIIVCGCIVAIRQLRHIVGLAALSCITVALVASGPSLYGMNEYFGLTVVYDRLLMSELLVLFLHSFTCELGRPKDPYIDALIAALLLNMLFLVKISGVPVGFAIVAVGLILRGPLWRGLVRIFIVLLFFAIIVAIDFLITGNAFLPVIREYKMAAQGRAETISAGEVLWFARRPPVLWVVVLMALYAVSRPGVSRRKYIVARCFIIIAFFWFCQVVLNMSNGSAYDLIILAPAAAVAVVTWTDPPDAASFWNHLWRGFHLAGLHKIAARQLIPLIVIALVIVPEAVACLKAVKLDFSVYSGSAHTITLSTGNGIVLNLLEGTYASRPVPALESAIHAIEELGASRDKIANLDEYNPFPVLFLAPDPKGVWIWWNFRRGLSPVPVGYQPNWREVIGDACIVTKPQRPSSAREPLRESLIKAVEPYLATAFTVVYEDEFWKIWKRSRDCTAG